MVKFPFQEKSVEELIKEMNEALKNAKELTEEEERMYDAEYGYFDDDDEDDDEDDED